MKKLPKLYKKENQNIIDHNTKICYLKEEKEIPSIEETLTEIFNGFSHPYTIKVRIKTKEKEYSTYIVSKTKRHIITLENESIPIKDIQELEIIK